jgi:large subunit ribosomal protein L10e
MAKLRKFVAYKRLKRPYTRISKYRNKSFVRTRPHSKVIKYCLGNQHKDYECTLYLRTERALNVRHNSLESGRQSANKILEKKIGRANFFFKIRAFPHHILRENPLASGAGADRMSTGMKKSFGKAIGVAARVQENGIVVEVQVNKQHLALAKTALARFNHKMPFSGKIEVIERKIDPELLAEQAKITTMKRKNGPTEEVTIENGEEINEAVTEAKNKTEEAKESS